MPKIKPSLTLATLAVVGLAVWAGAQMNTSGHAMAIAADRFLAALDDQQRAEAVIAFDSPERLNWHFIPRDREGLSIKAMSPEQQALAFGLIQSGTSVKGGLKVTTIMSLEAILRELEKDRVGGPIRDPERYFISIFGKPADQGRWGWRIEGHHLSLNFTIEDGRVISATPAFFGANPAEVRSGPRAGLRPLAVIEDRALRLFQALDETQREAAVISETVPGDILSNTGGQGGLPPRPPAIEDGGLPVRRLNADQRKMLSVLIRAYASNMPPEIARGWLGEVERSGDDIRFAWYGAADRNQKHAYFIQGKTFLIEFNNTQNGANHIHSSWRSMLGDFGLPELQ